MFSAGFKVAKHRHFFPNAREVVNGDLHLRRTGHGEQVKDGVSGAAQRDDDGDGILECLFRHNIARANAELQQIQNGGAGQTTILFLGGAYRCLRAAAREAHSHRLDGAGHCVGGVHSAARTRAGNGAAFHFFQALIVEAVIGVCADGFKHRNDIQLTRIARDAAG